MNTLARFNHSLNKAILITLIYFGSGYASLFLTIPPGYSSSIWPAGGVALAVILIYGLRYLPSIFIGSLLINTLISYQHGVTFALTHLLLPTIIAIGATLQVLLSTILIRKYISLPNHFENEKEVALLLLLGGPVGCMINASIASLALSMAGLIQWHTFLLYWLHWWIGDTIGVFLMTPLILILAQPSRLIPLIRKISILIPVLVIFILVILVFNYVKKSELENQSSEFAKITINNTVLLNEKIKVIQTALHSIVNLYDASVNVEALEFKRFANSLLQNEPSILALGWIAQVDANNLDQVKKLAEQERHLTLAIKEKRGGHWLPATPKPFNYVVFYSEPEFLHELQFGYDIASIPKLFSAMLNAKKFGQQVATEKVDLLNKKQSAFMIFEPVYLTQPSTFSLSDHINGLQGFAFAVVDIDQLINSSLIATQKNDLNLFVYDNYLSGKKALLFGKPAPKNDLTNIAMLNMSGRQWTLAFTPTPAFLIKQSSNEAWIVLISGFLFVGLLQVFLLSMTARTEIVNRLVAERTRDLTNSEAKQRTIAEERKKLIQQLITRNQELDDFTTITAHDLREPLRAINNHSAFLLEDYKDTLDQEGVKKLQRLCFLATRMHYLVSDLLHFSSLTREEMTFELTDLNLIIEDAITTLADSLQARYAMIALPRTLPSIYCNKLRVTELFRHLITNAFTYNINENILIEIGYIKNDEVVFYVKDNGIGIEPQFFESIFRIFKRLNSDKRFAAGTGAGLTFVKKIIDQHQGKIWLESTLNHGTIVYFTLAATPEQGS